MNEIARAAGVARSTVSKALRDDPTISPARCKEIQKLARDIGYRPNPMVSALMAQLLRHRRRTDPHHIAWIDLWPNNGARAAVPILKPLLRGARQRAEELGYAIEVHCVTAEGISAERLSQILVSRAQWGIIIPPVPSNVADFPLDLRGLTGVTIGTSFHHPVMHRVSPNHFQGAQLACDQLRAKGFRRIGFVLSPEMDERVDGKWLGAFLARQHAWPVSERVPPLLAGSDGEMEFKKWRARHLPDVFLIAEAHVLSWLQTTTKGGSDDIPVTWLVIETVARKAWGIDYQAERIGGAAVELLLGQIHRNERGSPAVPHTVLLDGVWVEGSKSS